MDDCWLSRRLILRYAAEMSSLEALETTISLEESPTFALPNRLAGPRVGIVSGESGLGQILGLLKTDDETNGRCCCSLLFNLIRFLETAAFGSFSSL